VPRVDFGPVSHAGTRWVIKVLAAWLLAVLALAIVGRAGGPTSPTADGPSALRNADAASLPPLPSGWPATFQLGMSDDQIGGAAVNASTAPFGFRYKYLVGNAMAWNWLNWGSNSGGPGGFVTDYIRQSTGSHMLPIFTWYMITGTAPSGINNLSTSVPGMTAYYQNLIAFLKLAAAFPSQKIVLHVEPDLWGYIEQGLSQATPDASLKPANVSNTGLPDLAGLPNNAAGFAQAFIRLRGIYAPNVILAYHVSIWGSNDDIIYSRPADSRVIADASRVAAFYTSLHARFDISFAEFRDRDAGFYEFQLHDAHTWYCPADFHRHELFMSTFSSASNLRLALWQIPYGNDLMRAENNTWDQYQDNKVEVLLGDRTRALLNQYLQAGVVALLFGRGAAGNSGPGDPDHDGIDNPAPIATTHCGVTTTNDRPSLNADDDGGYFREQAKTFYAAGAISLAGGYAPPIPPASRPPSSTATQSQPAQAQASAAASPTAAELQALRPSGSGLPVPAQAGAAAAGGLKPGSRPFWPWIVAAGLVAVIAGMGVWLARQFSKR
jgi:hypothetical protein